MFVIYGDNDHFDVPLTAFRSMVAHIRRNPMEKVWCVMGVDKQQEIELAISFMGGEADDHMLDFYDGADSLFGFSRALMITNNYLLKGKVSFHATSCKGAKLYMITSKKGSFEQIIKMVIEEPSASAFGLITGKVAWDFAKYMFSTTMGVGAKPETKVVENIVGREDPAIDALSEAIESPLKNAHRFIEKGSASKVISLGTSQSNYLRLDHISKSYLTERSILNKISELRGTVASFNVNSKAGRFFDLDLGYTMPFHLDKKGFIGDSSPITWSLDQRNRGLPGIIKIFAQKEVTSDGISTRYIVKRCEIDKK